MTSQQQALISQQLSQAAATLPGFHGSAYQQQLLASLSFFNQQQAELMASYSQQAQVAALVQPPAAPPAAPPHSPPALGTWPEMLPGAAGSTVAAGGAGGRGARTLQANAPASMCAQQMQSMAGGGSSGGDISQSAAYRAMVATQASALGGGSSSSQREEAHKLARQMAPT